MCVWHGLDQLLSYKAGQRGLGDPWDEGFLHAGGGEWVERRDSAIIVASRGGSVGLVRELVRLGAKVNARNIKNRDALMYASWYGHAAVVATLLDNGADPNTRDLRQE